MNTPIPDLSQLQLFLQKFVAMLDREMAGFDREMAGIDREMAGFDREMARLTGNWRLPAKRMHRTCSNNI